MPTTVDVPAWRSRLWAAQKLASYELPVWHTLEAACDGAYGVYVTTDEVDVYAGTTSEGRIRSGDQLDLNLMGRALKKRAADFYDRFPSLHFTKNPTDDRDVNAAMVKLAEKLMDEGDAVYAARRAMELSHTRGQYAVLPMFVRDRISESEIVAGKTAPAEYVESVLMGNEPYVPLGSDYEGIAQAAKTVLSPVDPAGMENPHYFALTEKQKNDVTLLLMRAEKAKTKAMKPPFSLGPRAKITFECLPYGSFCLVDASVTDFSKVGWIARKIVMTPAEFQAEPNFTAEAKAKIRPAPLANSDGGVPVAPDLFALAPDGRTVDQVGRITVWEVWDKINRKRYYFADGVDEPIGTSDRYPYNDAFGRPLFPDFFPFVWRTPWSRMRETSARVLGLPGLEPMWAPQIEYIKCISAFVLACKSTARVFLVGPGVDQASLSAVAKAQDCSFVKMSANYSPMTQGTLKDQFIQMPMSPAPIDYLNAAEKIKREAYESVHLSMASMTSQPQAGTATQEQLIAQGASGVESEIRGQFEDAFAEMAWKALLMFLEFANPQEFEAYLGAAALQPRKGVEAPQMGPDGQMIEPPPRPSIVDAMKNADLVGERIECRFASSTRQQDAMRIKTLEDILAIANNVRDGAGLPFVDLRDILQSVLSAADVEAGPHQPTEGEIAMQVAAMTQNKGIGNSGGGPDDHSDSRRANGERGAPASPGRQSRGRSPFQGANDSGNQHRRATATS